MTTLTPDNLLRQEIPRTKMRSGYVIKDVDDFLHEVVTVWKQLLGEGSAFNASTKPSLSYKDILNKKFGVTRFSEGYEMDAVDDMLDKVAVIWRELNDPTLLINLDDFTTKHLLKLNKRVAAKLEERMSKRS